MKVLVTGATGFVGRHTLAPLVAAGHEVHAAHVEDAPPAGAPSAVRWHHADLLDAVDGPRLVHGVRPEALVHLAWYAAHGLFWTSSENLRWLAASVELLRAFAGAGGRRFVGAGTCAEYDWTRLEGPCVEDETPTRPATLYGVTKDALRRVTEAFATQGGLSWAWGRIFFLYGPGEHPDRLVPSLARALRAGQPAPMSHGRQVRDFLHVEDVARAFAHLVDTEVAGPVNVASGTQVTLAEIGASLAAMAGRPELLQLGARAAGPSEPPLLFGDAARLRASGWAPRWTLEAGLRSVLESET